MKKGRCPLCKRITTLQKHHYIPKRIKEINHFILICKSCHQKIHPENQIILEAKYIRAYLNNIKKFIKQQYPEVWLAWQPIRTEIKKKFKEERKNEQIPGVVDD